MSYKTDFETELARKLNSSETAESIIRWVWEKHLSSYKNDVKAGNNGETVKRSGESRGRDSFGKAE